jgi:tetratricopeptide (TPR) repeat protein
MRARTNSVCLLFTLASIAFLFVPSLRAQTEKWTELNDRMEILYQQEKFEEAVAVAREAVKLAEKTFGEKDLRMAMALVNLQLMLEAQGKSGEASPLHMRIVTIRRESGGFDSPDIPKTYDEVLKFWHALKKNPTEIAATWREDSEYWVRASQALPAGYGKLYVAVRISDLAVVLTEAGKHQEAQSLFERAIAAYEEVAGPNDRGTAITKANYAVLLRKIGKDKEAEALEKRAEAIMKKWKFLQQ